MTFDVTAVSISNTSLDAQVPMSKLDCNVSIYFRSVAGATRDNTLSYCDYASSLALPLTCRAAYYKATKWKAQQYSMTDLLQIELWPCYDGAGQANDYLKQPLVNRDYFASHLCLRVRATTKFSNAMMKGKRGKHCLSRNDKQSSRLTRFCIDCGISSGRYPPGTTFDFGGVSFGGLEERSWGGLSSM